MFHFSCTTLCLAIAICVSSASPTPSKPVLERTTLLTLKSRRTLLGDDIGTDLSPAARVIHGTPVRSQGEYQFVVDLAKDPEHISSSRFCTGTLIRPNVVLTAAHCVLNEGDMSGTFASIGRIHLEDDHEGNSGSQTLRAVAGYVHPEYNGLGSSADVALLLLEGASKKKPVKLSNMTPPSGAKTTIVGYGIKALGTVEATHNFVQVMPKNLMMTDLKIEARSFCDTPGQLETAQGMLCTSGLHHGSSACRGDSGGGLFMKTKVGNDNSSKTEHVQVGIVSYGDAMCRSEDAGVFTDVHSVHRWINAGVDKLNKLAKESTQTVHVPVSGRMVHQGTKGTFSAGDKSVKGNVKFFKVVTADKPAAGERVELSLCSSKVPKKPHMFLVNSTGRHANLVKTKKHCKGTDFGLAIRFDAKQGSDILGLGGINADGIYELHVERGAHL